MAEDKEQVTIEVKSTSDVTALDATNKQLNNAATSGRAAQVGAMDASKGFAALGQAASAASSGGIGPLAAALGGMAQQLPKLAGAAGPIGLAIAAFVTWKKVIDQVISAHLSLEKGLRAIEQGNFEARIKSLASAYADVAKELDNYTDARERSQSLADEQTSADRRLEDVQMELAKQKALSALPPEDDLGRKRIENEYALKSATLAVDRERYDASTSAGRMNRQAEEQDASGISARGQKEALLLELEASSSRTSGLVGLQNKAAQGWYLNDMNKERAIKQYQPEIDKQLKVQSDLIAQIAQLDATIRATSLNSSDLRQRAGIVERAAYAVAPVAQETAAVSASAAENEVSREAAKRINEERKLADEIAAKEAAAARARSSAAGATAEGERLRGDVRNEERDVYQADRALGSLSRSARRGRAGKDAEAELRRQESELREANTTLGTAIPQLAKVVSDALATAKRLEAEVKRLRERQKNSRSDTGNID